MLPSEPQAAKPNCAFVLLNYSFADPEAQTSPLCFFRREKGFEKSLGVFWVNTRSGVANGGTDPLSPGARFNAFIHSDAQAPSLRHRLDRVSNNV